MFENNQKSGTESSETYCLYLFAWQFICFLMIKKKLNKVISIQNSCLFWWLRSVVKMWHTPGEIFWLSAQIPSSAVEMPGSADVPGLNVQFGALDFVSDTSNGVADLAQTETGRDQVPASASMSVPTAVSTQQPQSSLFPKPGSIRWVYVSYYPVVV